MNRVASVFPERLRQHYNKRDEDCLKITDMPKRHIRYQVPQSVVVFDR